VGERRRPNGAGESTAFKTIVGFLRPRATRALAIAARAYVRELGRNRFEGPGRDLLVDPEVKRLYLGG